MKVRDALADLDARIAAHGVVVWVGAEPTFTRAESIDPCWHWQAESASDEKRTFVAAVAEALAARVGGTATEVPGRHYPEEEAPRFCVAVRWAGHSLTVTLDPGVVEVNTAPSADGVAFLEQIRDVYAAAATAGLSPRRLRYNGDCVDSGGGGQLTLGGPSFEASPFALHPALLPRLVRYCHVHPSLGYWFLGEMAGSASQSPRADEGVRERWEELRLACAHLERSPCDLADQWATLAPLLVDAAGNSHRAELNIEKLANPHLEDRGKMGVVELRAFRMPAMPEALAAAAALLRAVAARCAIAPVAERFHDFGGDLHDRASLPFFLHQDLLAVFADLDAHGLGLGPDLERFATGYRNDVLWHGEPFRDVEITVSRALEFWPLVGDVASQERATSRRVDASSERVEIRVQVPAGRAPPELVVATLDGDARVALRPARVDPEREVHLIALRRRIFVPSPGLHPSIPALDPLELRFREDGHDATLRLHGWRPDSGAYDGLPADDVEAERRRAARFVFTAAAPAAPGPVRALAPPDTWTLDLRAL
jgi:uncharacterized protein (DUF2126 family)